MRSACFWRILLSTVASTVLCIAVACGTVLASGALGTSSSTSSTKPPVGTTGNCDSPSAPAPAAAAGFTKLSFCDDFDSISTIDVNGTGAQGYKWYTNLPPWWGMTKTEPSTYDVSGSALALTGNPNTHGWGISTKDPRTGSGVAFTFGYFEARISFDPTLWSQSSSWPAFWSIDYPRPAQHYENTLAELDFFEAFDNPALNHQVEFLGTLHEWQDNMTIDYFNKNSRQPVNVNWNNWHTVAALWTTGQVSWYLDDRLLMTQSYEPDGVPNPLALTKGGNSGSQAGIFSILDNDTMDVILGSAPGWPMRVDWVRIWQE